MLFRRNRTAGVGPADKASNVQSVPSSTSPTSIASPAGVGPAGKPSVTFSTSSTSTTSRGSTRSGPRKLLFGEIDTSVDRSKAKCAYANGLISCTSTALLSFWLAENTRETWFSHMSKRDLAELRLVCNDFAKRAAPWLFQDLRITFVSNLFTRPARFKALERIGEHVRNLTFTIPHTADTFLPPLIHPATGEFVEFLYSPTTEPSSPECPKYGDLLTTELLTRQWPVKFHAATNVRDFVRMFSFFVNLYHLEISTPGYDNSRPHRCSAVDYALNSLRIAVERNDLMMLRTLTLDSIHPAGYLHLSPIQGCGVTPRSLKRWTQIKDLTIRADMPAPAVSEEMDLCKRLQTYLRTFSKSLRALHFEWKDVKGPLPTKVVEQAPCHPALRSIASPHLKLPKLEHAKFENLLASPIDIANFVDSHKDSLREIDFQATQLAFGTWDDAYAPLYRLAKRRPPFIVDPPVRPPSAAVRPQSSDYAEIPIMLCPTALQGPCLAPTTYVDPTLQVRNARSNLRRSKRLSARQRVSGVGSTNRVREGLLEAEEQLKKVLRGSMFGWI